jgi:hypothetical protein
MNSLEEILALGNLSSLDAEVALDVIAHLVDFASDDGSLFGVATALRWCDELDPRLDSQQRSRLDYFRANAWAFRQAASQQTVEAAWGWDQPTATKLVYHLRSALRSESPDGQVDFHRCQVLTNLGNQLDTLGRPVAGQRAYTKALHELPSFWMARGNRARVVLGYADALYDHGHKALIAAFAHREMKMALEHMEKHPSFGDASVLDERLKRQIAHIGQSLDVASALENLEEKFDLGSDDAERAYRVWCLNETLFLNPLNDLGPYSIAAKDVLLLPDLRVAIGEPPVLIGFYNQLKQEFATARWLLYEGLVEGESHFSDGQVLLTNTLDYTAFGLAIEKLKTAFRLAYSLLDKVAYFLNYYLALGIKENQVNFKKIWLEGSDKHPRVRQSLEASRNWSLRGLYWLGKDLFEDKLSEVAEPEAEELAQMRHHLEHKYLKVHWLQVPERSAASTAVSPFKDTLAYSISREQLEQRSLHALRLAREALIYLSLGVHAEEHRRERESPSVGLTAAMELPALEDERKRRT